MEDHLGRLVGLISGKATARGGLLVGVAGGVASGKSTLAQAIAAAVAPGFSVQVVATDGFLKPNSALAEAGLIHRKGFPETFEVDALHGFLGALASGRPAAMPVYSHVAYDIVPGETRTVDAGGVVIVEGVNVLQTAEARSLFDLSIYVDADPAHARAWYLARLDRIIAEEPQSLIAQIPDPDLRARLIEQAWTDINLVNLRDHIAPTADYAGIVVRKAADHAIVELVERPPPLPGAQRS